MPNKKLNRTTRLRSHRFMVALFFLGLVGTILGLALIVPNPSSAQNDVLPISYGDYAYVLSRYVNEQGLVDYTGLKADQAQLNSFLETIADLKPSRFTTWSQNDQIAFYINAYNALTLKSVLNQYPVASIRKIPGVWSKTEHAVLGKQLTLNDIEHKILRKNFNEPRIHFALVCASLGCPRLPGEPFTGKKLEAQLQSETMRFLSLASNFKMTKEEIYLSSIFEWYGKDFESKYKTNDRFKGQSVTDRAVLNLIYLHSSNELKDALVSREFSIRYLDYEWALNDQKKN